MSREEALKSYTANNAYAAFEDKLKGRRQDRLRPHGRRTVNPRGKSSVTSRWHYPAWQTDAGTYKNILASFLHNFHVPAARV